MDVRFEDIERFALACVSHTCKENGAFQDVPPLWCAYFEKGLHEKVCGCYGVSVMDSEEEGTFRYLIGDNWEMDAPVPEGFTKEIIPALTWAKFRCVGPMPTALQSVNRKIFSEWLPAHPEYAMSAPYVFEWYSEGDMDSDGYLSEVWIPIQRK